MSFYTLCNIFTHFFTLIWIKSLVIEKVSELVYKPDSVKDDHLS